jgi:RNA polymerase sigma factor (sigma-70 family)
MRTRGAPEKQHRVVKPPTTVRVTSSSVLLAQVRQGDRVARDQLALRYVEALRRFAHGRLPMWARSLKDTEDLVQDTVLRALRHVGDFVPRREGAFLAYLRQIVLNQVRDEVRRRAHRAERRLEADDLPDNERSPLEQAIGNQAVEMYEKALASLREEQREAVILRLEFGYTYEQIADALGKRTANAARMAVVRALACLSDQLSDLGPGS